jgi:hypothetical protein
MKSRDEEDIESLSLKLINIDKKHHHKITEGDKNKKQSFMNKVSMYDYIIKLVKI